MLSNMFAIKTWTFVVLFACLVYGQRKPPNYQQNEMPPTSFSCKDKIVGGYYADPETSCQMFHVCVNVVGTGVQDFRFLCPNDTAFDQENQICDDWYNIDCEAATLYYSDNFDLYKLGSGGAPATAGKATPIPLGPSSASPSVQQPRSRKPSLSAPVNNAVSEPDDDYYLQRSDSSDGKLQHDLLRGSSSGNFFSNRNRGVENPDDYDDAGRVQTSAKDVPKKNAKAPFRKLLTGKKPIAAESSTGASSTTTTTTTTSTSTTEALYRSAAGSTTTVRQPNYKPTTYRSKDRGRVNYKTYLDKQTKADEYDFQKLPKPAAVQSSTFAPASSSYQPTTARAAYQTTPQVNGAQPFAQANQPRTKDFLRIVPNNNNKNNNNNNNNNNNGFQSTRTNVAPNNNNNFQANNVYPANNNNNNNNFQSNKVFPANNNNNNFQANNAFPANNNNNNNNFQANNAFPASANNNNNFQANSAFQANNNNFQANNAFLANNNNNFQANNAFPPNNNNFQGNNVYQPANNANNKNFQQQGNFNQGLQADKVYSTTAQNFNQANFQSEKIHAASTTTTQKYVQNPTTNAYQTNSFQQPQGAANTFQPSNTFQQANAFQAGNNAYAQQQGGQFQNAAPTTQKYNTYQPPVAYQQSTNVFQSSTPYNAGNGFQPQQQQQQQQPQTSQQPQFQSTTERFSKDYKAKFDPYNSYHQRTNEEAGETLKTASSTNLRPSDLNSLIHAKPKSINATLSVGYSFNKADGGVAKSTVLVPAPTTQKPRPFTTQPPITTTVQATSSSRAAVTGTTAAASTKKTVVKDKDSTYDYAYYDDSNHNDYTDVVPEDFSRIHNTKN